MTDFVDYPQVQVDLPADGKVTGSFILVVRGERAVVFTHYGSEFQSEFTYRGKAYIGTRLELVRNADGTVVLHEEERPEFAFSKKGSFAARDYAPASYWPVLVEAARAAAEEAWTEVLVAQGKIARASQRLCLLEHERKEVASKISRLDEEISEALALLVSGQDQLDHA